MNFFIRKICLVQLLLFSSTPLLANTATCDSLGGSIMLRDAIYGGLIGVAGTGLGILATESKQRHPQRLAIGSLVGFSLGVGFGAFETFSRKCGRTETSLKTETASWTPQPFLSSQGHMGLSLNWSLL